MADVQTATPIQPSVVVIPPVEDLLASQLGVIMCAFALYQALCNTTTTTDTPEAEPVAAFSHRFEKPRYSNAFIHAMHQIILQRDTKITQIEQKRERATRRPTRDDGCANAKCAMRPLSRWYDGIKDPEIAAVYKSTLQRIRRLTSGRR